MNVINGRSLIRCVVSLGRPMVPLFVLASLVPAFAAEPMAAQFGIEQRVRSESWNNLYDFSGASDDEREQIRFRTRVWARLPLTTDIEFNVGLNTEMFQKFGQTNVYDEGIFETLNINIRKLFVNGLSLKVGRQDLMRGEGFVLYEGTPADGSRSMYFNAVNLAWQFHKSKIEAIGILNPRQDRFLPRFNDQHKYLQNRDEQALGLYYTDKNLRNMDIEAYFFHKKEVNDHLASTNAQFQPDRRVETLGGRFTRRFNPRWTAVAEYAGQWGVQHAGAPIRAWGGYGYVKRQSGSRRKPYGIVGFWALSGDDPAHPERISGWDPIFSRWPRWGDLEMYAGVPEKGISYATNQQRLQLEAGFSPFNQATWKFVYYAVGAFHPFAGSATMFGPGTRRGNVLQSRLDFVLNPQVRGHVDYETMSPGAFYSRNGRAYFLRFELLTNLTATVEKFTALF